MSVSAEGGQPGSPRPRRTAAAMLAAGMLALDELLGRKKREEAPIIVDADGEPVDIDADGIELVLEDDTGETVAVKAPPLPRSRPTARPPRRRRRA